MFQLVETKIYFFDQTKAKKERKYGLMLTALSLILIRQIRYQTYSFFFFLIDNLRINLSCGYIFMS